MDRRQFTVWTSAMTITLGALADKGGPAAFPRADVLIDIDRNGIPHIRASSVPDAFFGQGYAAAWQRLWQLDINHRRLAGRLAEVFGAAFVPFDHAARLMLSQVPPEQDWTLLGGQMHTIATAWAAGVNRRIAEVRADPSLRPPEFTLFEMAPLEWTADDMVRLRYCGSPNARAEFRRALLHQQGLLHLDALAQKLEPAIALQVPEGLDTRWFRPGQLSLFEKLSQPLPWAQATHPLQRVALREVAEPDDADQGSNAWVIAGRHTESGHPILANDPHLAFSIPGPRMVTHLSAPGFNVIGAGPVWRPGVQFGHNEHIAFGRTDFQIDQEDLYVLELDAQARHYRGAQGMVPVVRRTEAIAVRDQAAVDVELAWTPLGPIIHEDREAGRALALRAAWLEPGACVQLEYVPKLFAHDWPSFRAALRAAVWGTNYIYADRSGHIGWQAAGRVPVRARHDGLMPVPAAGGHDWTGVLPLDDMPHEFDPPRGWIGTANQCPLAPNWPANGRTISHEWKPDDRYRRVEQLLQAQVQGPARTTLAASWRDQQDVLSLRAVELTELLGLAVRAGWGDANTIPEPLGETVQRLLGWDARMEANSTAATLYAAWWSQLNVLARQTLLPANAQPLIEALHPHAVVAWLRGLIEADAQRNSPAWKVLEQTLLRARERAQPDGKDPVPWGDLHRVNLRHPLRTWLPRELHDHLDATGGRSGGDGATVHARWYASFERPAVSGGASFRAVLETGDWSSARAINFPGQSADPRSPHYRDLYDRWIRGDSFSLPFSDDEVREASARRLHLRPQP